VRLLLRSIRRSRTPRGRRLRDGDLRRPSVLRVVGGSVFGGRATVDGPRRRAGSGSEV